MLNLSFDNTLRQHQFRRQSSYIYNELIESSIFVARTNRKVPLIFRGPATSHAVDGNLVYSLSRQFRGYKVTKLQLIEIFNTAPIPIIVPYMTYTLLVGKGFLARYDRTNVGNEMTVLVFVQAPNRPVIEVSDLDYIVDRKLYLAENRGIQSAIMPFIDTHTGEVLITPNIQKYLGDKVKLPRFANISQRRTHVDNLLLRAFEKVKEEFV